MPSAKLISSENLSPSLRGLKLKAVDIGPRVRLRIRLALVLEKAVGLEEGLGQGYWTRTRALAGNRAWACLRLWIKQWVQLGHGEGFGLKFDLTKNDTGTITGDHAETGSKAGANAEIVDEAEVLDWRWDWGWDLHQGFGWVSD